ncbi:huntingtin isoform X2 [Lampetra fluviatilis]
MTPMERLVKAFETLKASQGAGPAWDADEQQPGPGKTKKEGPANKKERISYCQTIAETIISSNVRNSSDFPKFLGIAVETFLLCCDDTEADVRMVADECLNKVIKALMDTHVARLQLELYKEIKKNGASRSLRAALWRFAELAHLIRPQKCRPYMLNLLPCLVHVSRRLEEPVQETLAGAVPKMVSVLGSFTNDGEIKTLLRAFVLNLKSGSAAMRRAASTCAVAVCQHSRRPHAFYAWLLSVLLGLVTPLGEARLSSLLLGVLHCLRAIVPHVQQPAADAGLKGSFGVTQREADAGVAPHVLVQVYEVTLFYTQHPEHNVATTALEMLQQLLRMPPSALQLALTTAGGIRHPLPCARRSASVSSLVGGWRKMASPVLPKAQAKLLSAEEEKEEDVLEDDVEARGSDGTPTPSPDTALLSALSESGEVLSALSALSGGAGPEPGAAERPCLLHALDSSDSIDLNAEESDSTSLSTEPAESSSQLSATSLEALGAVGCASLRPAPTSPVSESSQTTEGPDSAVTPSDNSEPVLDCGDLQYTALPMGALQEPDGGGGDDEEEEESRNALPRDRTPRHAPGVAALLQPRSRPVPPPEGADEDFDGSGAEGSKPLVIKGIVGEMTDEDTPPIIHCVRLISASFLLTGTPNGLVSDRCVRVSMKALAVGCVASAVSMLPSAFFLPLYRRALHPEPQEQQLSDLLQFISHPDPQLRGNVAVLCGVIVSAVLATPHSAILSPAELEDVVRPLHLALKDSSSVTCRLACVGVRHCVMQLCNSKQSGLGLTLLSALLHLHDNSYWLVRTELMDTVADIDFRLIAFLEKNVGCHSGCDEKSEERLQDRAVASILRLLSDEDGRVRHAAAASLSRLVPNLFFECDQAQSDPVVAIARAHTASCLELLVHENSAPPRYYAPGAATAAACPYRGYETSCTANATLENNLSRIITAISTALNRSKSRHLKFGCCEALYLLSAAYPVSMWSNGWHCGFVPAPAPPPAHARPQLPLTNTPRTGVEGGGRVSVLPILLTLLSSSWFPLDLPAHQDALLLTGNLIAAVACRSLRRPCVSEDDAAMPKVEEPWAALADRSLVPMVEQLFSHLLKLLNICTHVLDDVPPVQPTLKPTLPTLPSAPSLSPIRKKTKERDAVEFPPAPASPRKPGEPGAGKAGEGSGGGVGRSVPLLGGFYHLPHYVRLHDILKATYTNYKMSLDMLSLSEKFGGFLGTVLDVLAQLLEIATLQDVGKYAEEVLGYLKSCFNREPTVTTLCVQQLLKALFGTNLVNALDGAGVDPRGQGRGQQLGSSGLQPGLYHYCFMAPYTQFTQALASASLRNMAQTEVESDTLGWFDILKRKASQVKSSPMSATKQKADKGAIHNYIRLFEPLVIKALKQYTITTSVALQKQVLSLLVQLVQLRVNYCLLDSDQVFIGFVIKQFEFIEEGQIKDSETLIPYIFYFLVLLSYERYHSKSIIGMPKIIQLCDGLMASGRKAITHAIPALQPIVHDLFVVRGANKADVGKELETQKEVVVSMLLRLIHYHQVLELLVLVLQQCRKESEDKWKKLSRQVTDLVLPMLAKQQINTDSREALRVLNTLFEEVSPSALRPVDMLLKSMFVLPCDVECVTTVQKWISGILAILRVLISQSSEDIILSRMQELAGPPVVAMPPCGLRIPGSGDETLDTRGEEEEEKALPPGNAEGPEAGDGARGRAAQSPEPAACAMPPAPGPLEGSPLNAQQQQQPDAQPAEERFARFMIQLVGILFERTENGGGGVGVTPPQHALSAQQLGALLMCLIHMFKSGTFRRTSGATVRLLRQEKQAGQYSLGELNELAGALIPTQPCSVLLWCQLLLLMDFTERSWWEAVLRTQRRPALSGAAPHPQQPHESAPESQLLCGAEMVRRGSFILFADYVCQNLHDSEHMTWLIVNHVRDLVALASEPPVQDCVSAVHRNAAASGLFIQAIQSRGLDLTKPVVLRRTLQRLEGIHLSQSGAVLSLLVESFLATPLRVLGHMVDTLACRRVEMLLAENLEDSSSQLPIEDLERIQSHLQQTGLSNRHKRLASLLDRLHEVMAAECGVSPRARLAAHPLTEEEGEVAPQNVTPNKAWFVSLVRGQCFQQSCSAAKCAELLGQLPDSTELLSVLRARECNLAVLRACVSLGAFQLGLGAGEGTALLRSAVAATMELVADAVARLPVSAHVFRPATAPLPNPYWAFVSAIAEDEASCGRLMRLAECVVQALLAGEALLSAAPAMPGAAPALGGAVVPPEREADVCHFALLTLEVICCQAARGRRAAVGDVQAALECCCLVMQQPRLWELYASARHVTWACSLLNCLRFVLRQVLSFPMEKYAVPVPQNIPRPQDAAGGHVAAMAETSSQACETIAALLQAVLGPLSAGDCAKVPPFLVAPIKQLVVNLARLPLVNSFARTPPIVWKMGWMPTAGGVFGTTLSEIPIEFLRDKDVLKEFVCRLNTIGWTSRTQFEESWATLLGVLVMQPLGLEPEGALSAEEESERTQLSVLSVRSITALVLSAMLLPTAGSPAGGCMEQQPRNKAIEALNTRIGRKLYAVRCIVEREIWALASKRDGCATHYPYQEKEPIFSLTPSGSGCLVNHRRLLLQANVERDLGNTDYKHGQISVHSIWLSTKITPLRAEELEGEEEEDVELQAESLPSSPLNSRKQRVSVDVHSCSQFLLELYGQWLLAGPSSRRVPCSLASEVVKSLLMISDLFSERSQYEAMFAILTELLKVHPTEDEIFSQYSVPAICKAAAVLGMDRAMAEPVSQLLELTLRSAHISCRVGALHGVLYVLECDLLEETTRQLIPAVSHYLLRNLEGIAHCVNLHSQQHALLMCAAAFYLIENYPDDIEQDFTARVIQICGVVISGNEESTSSIIYHCVLRGLERLALSGKLSKMDGDALVKLSVERLNMSSPHRALAALGLMLTCMYKGREKGGPSSGDAMDGGRAADETESTIVAMERVSVLFDRLRRGVPCEAGVVSRILPQFLDDFFPPQDIMNKIIGEFLSSQQPYPQFMAYVVYKVFQGLHDSGRTSMVREWVMLSLSNFTQRTPMSMAVWSLSCFFVSASHTQWISALFPYVISRIGKFENADRRLFCVLGLDFYRNQLEEELDRRAFQSVLEVVAAPGNPYAQLLVCLASVQQSAAL